MSELTLKIDGMHCGSCVRRVTQAIQRVPGLEVKEVRIGAARVESEGETPTESVIEALAKAGYHAHVEQ